MRIGAFGQVRRRRNPTMNPLGSTMRVTIGAAAMGAAGTWLYTRSSACEVLKRVLEWVRSCEIDGKRRGQPVGRRRRVDNENTSAANPKEPSR